MDLSSGLPFPLIRSGLLFDYPKLEEDIHSDVIIIGGGISGALMAYHLVQAGIDCALLDGRTIGLGSTAASTSILQYEIDVPLSRLSDMIGKQHAERAYKLCEDSIHKLKKIANHIGVEKFYDRNSLYFAEKKMHASLLKREYEARKNAGFEVEFLSKKEIETQFGFSSEAAICSEVAAQTDAYSFTHDLLQYCIGKGMRVYDRSVIKSIQSNTLGVLLKTENTHTVRASKLINATGYEVVNFVAKNIVRLHSTYAIVSEHSTAHKVPWEDQTILWSTGDPYLYMTSLDGRVLVGGADERFYNPKRRDMLIKKKSSALAKKFHHLFPAFPFHAEFGWTGTFGITKDGLPYIGRDGKNKHTYYALGFGGNGITFSQVAAEIITDLLLGKKNSAAELFAFNR